LTKVSRETRLKPICPITFVTAGDPDLQTTRRLVLAMEEAGADLVELGVPYSDPIAEGPVIQAANRRALKNDVRSMPPWMLSGSIYLGR
jgi:tryptophan synthase alpha subunit